MQDYWPCLEKVEIRILKLTFINFKLFLGISKNQFQESKEMNSATKGATLLITTLRHLKIKAFR